MTSSGASGGRQFHLETTRAGAREMVAHCGADLASSRFVQSEAEMLSADDARFVTINGLMMETLNAISGAEVIDLSPAAKTRTVTQAPR